MAYYSTGASSHTRLSARKPHLPAAANTNSPDVNCDWHVLHSQLLAQWERLTPFELEAAGKNRRRIASLIQAKYGISLGMAENYLLNFERTLPLFGCAP